ncbi:MAG TPA: PQQ-dependent sugar dehydrogenase [Planctomycetaceae bacterium]|nr:PQQ-dependent sugar dehydrogenase [Planctomycetaceae bacterium]
MKPCGGIVLTALMFVSGFAFAAEPSKPFNTQQRQLWTTNHIVGTPDPPDPYTTELAFPQLKLHEPLSVGLIPGSNRFGVATRPGKIYSFEIRRDVEDAKLLLDVSRTVYGLVFHPDFANNGYLYVMSMLPGPESPTGSRISRYRMKRGDTWEADPASEQIVLEWPSGGHNGGCLRFGPDGCLYIATGDGSGVGDSNLSGQDITDLTGSLLRIDVDHPDAGRHYGIPKDNPFVTTPKARGEIYSFGHRQVWKFSFDRQQRLWAGDVGQDLWEMVYLVKRGGNYGWSVNEGNHPFRPERARGPGAFELPIVEHPHSDFRSITGGYFSYTDRLPELRNAYIYGDYDTGKLWAFKHDGQKVTEHRQLADTQIRIVEFAQDAAGDVYMVDFAGGGFHRLVPAPPVTETRPFPRKLSETGLFASTKDHIPTAGLIPYSVNAPLWSDGAEKERFIALPGDGQIQFDSVLYPHGANYADLGWRFPDGSVLVKTFALDMEAGNPASRKRLETRILQYRKMPGNDDEYGAQYWFGYTYIWNNAQTDADLAPAEGVDRTFTIRDAKAENGQRDQTWRFPSRAECTLCHTMASKYILGVTTLQMNKDHDYGHGVVKNQLAVLNDLKVFQKPLPKPPQELPRLVDYHDTTASKHLRARSYLHANCAHCHRVWGGGNADFDLQASIPLTATKSINVRPGQGTFQLNDPRVIVPGDPDRSMILKRMQLTTLGRMPHVASKVMDQPAIDLIREWLAELKDESLLEKPGAINPRLPMP